MARSKSYPPKGERWCEMVTEGRRVMHKGNINPADIDHILFNGNRKKLFTMVDERTGKSIQYKTADTGEIIFDGKGNATFVEEIGKVEIIMKGETETNEQA